MGRVTAAQAADELLNIIGIDTSFVLAGDGELLHPVLIADGIGRESEKIHLAAVGVAG